MSLSTDELFFITIPSCYFHCSGALYHYRDNLRIEVASDVKSLIESDPDPELELWGVHIRITNRTKRSHGHVRAYIKLDHPLYFDLDKDEKNRDYARAHAGLENQQTYDINQVCCTIALLELFEDNELAILFETRSEDLVLRIDAKGKGYPRISLNHVEKMWLRAQKPSRTVREQQFAMRGRS